MNLRFQLMQALNFKEGSKKKEYYRLHGKRDKGKIFSYQEQKNIKETASQFTRWMQEEHKEIKRVRDIKKEHVQEWMDLKAKNCSLNTLDAYRARLVKIEVLCNRYYESCHLDWKGIKKNMPSEKRGSKDGEKIRDLAFEEEQWNLILSTRKNKKCESYKALRLAEITGQRVSSLVKFQKRDFDFENRTITVFRAKGGRTWSIPMYEKYVEELKNLVKDLDMDENLIKVKPNSITKYLNNACKECGLVQFPKQDTEIHAVRKMIAQREYDRMLREGKSLKEAEEWINVFLGHGKNRKDLVRIYVLKR